ncbi:hypothetical protein BDZ91DRAFT_154655 [Kalaharituber pfeilii]|nr:hypothetical protein BDZ91DRAFT_154655 [Kalaharituber pfeilii]
MFDTSRLVACALLARLWTAFLKYRQALREKVRISDKEVPLTSREVRFIVGEALVIKEHLIHRAKFILYLFSRAQ